MFPFSDNNPTQRFAFCTYAIIIANIVCFLWVNSLSDLDQVVVSMKRGFVPARISQITSGEPLRVNLGAVAEEPHLPNKHEVRPLVMTYPADTQQILLTLVTCMFFHGGWMHLIGNMWFLFIFGNNIEDRLGHLGFVLFYLVGGILATGCHYIYQPGSTIPVIGASGAIAAVLGAYLVTYPHAQVRTLIIIGLIFIWELPAWLVLGFWFVMQVMEASGELQKGIGGGVALWAHIGGFVAGAAIIWLLRGRATTGSERNLDDPSDIDSMWPTRSKY